MLLVGRNRWVLFLDCRISNGGKVKSVPVVPGNMAGAVQLPLVESSGLLELTWVWLHRKLVAL